MSSTYASAAPPRAGRARRRERPAGAVVALAVMLLFAPAKAPAAEFRVGTFADTIDVAPGDGACRDASGDCSLRAAVLEANAVPGLDRIELAEGRYAFARDGDDDDSARGDLDVVDDLELVGAGRELTAIDAAHIDRAFEVPAPGASLSLTGVTIGHGGSPDLPTGQGGAIRFVGGAGDALTVSAARIAGNTAPQAGGGVWAAGPEIDIGLTETLVEDNVAGGGSSSADGRGGGIFVRGAGGDGATLTITGGAISGNRAGGGGGEADGWGGGLAVEGHAEVSIQAAALSSNDAAVDAGRAIGQGGAVYVAAGDHPTALRVEGSSLVGSDAGTGGASGDGGAIFFTASSDTASLEVASSTLSHNDAGGGDAASGGRGGAIFSHASLTIRDSLLSHNRAGTSTVDGGQGGAVFMNYNGLAKPSIDVVRSVVSENSAGPTAGGRGGDSGRGGAIFLNQTSDHMRIVESAIIGNVARGSGPNGSAQGGGIYFFCSADPNRLDRIVDSTISGNSALAASGSEGGGVWLHVDDDVEVTRSLIASNSAGDGTGAAAAGGGIYLYVEADGATEVVNSTVTANAAAAATTGGESLASGGGAFLTGDTVEPQRIRFSTVSHNALAGSGSHRGGANLGSDRPRAGIEIGASVISNGSGPSGYENCAAPDGTDENDLPDSLAPAVTSRGGNVTDAAPSRCGLEHASDRAADPLLGPLGDHGGATRTRPLIEGSPALDAAGLTCEIPSDQRGVARPAGAGCDAGAFEGAIPDSFAPDAWITAGPPDGTLTSERVHSFRYAGADIPRGSLAFRCRIDAGPEFDCGTGAAGSLTTQPLADGTHTVSIIAVDRAGNSDPTPATRSLSVDATSPETRIVGGPRRRKRSRRARFRFEAINPATLVAEPARFECRLDRGPWKPCASPNRYRRLRRGRHRFAVRSFDSLGNQDATAATRRFRILRSRAVKRSSPEPGR